MSNKIFNAIWSVALIVFVASLVFVMGVSYTYFSGVQKDQLKIETELAAQGAMLGGTEYFELLKDVDYRITWIDSDGTVIYDNEADSGNMENHMQREEVKEAVKYGWGDASRYSTTLSERQFYEAKLLSDGSILRLSSKQITIWTLLLAFGQPIAFVALLALIASLILASRLSKRIVEPINKIDPERPLDFAGKKELKEIEPLLRRMNMQQTEIKRNQEQLERTSQIHQEFTANASHELKTPLHAISGYAELLENGMVKPEDIRPFAGKIRNEAQRMTKLVSDILDLTKLDDDSGEMQWEEVDLSLVARNAIDSVEAEADDMGISIEFSGETAVLQGIPQLLYSIVYNLCDNAIKYNRPGGAVKVFVSSSDDSAVLSVRDTGIGIPEEHKSRIFERFYRVDKSHSREIGGTGLGLSIVKHAALIHHADITVSGKEKEGTTFTVVFPKCQY